MRKLLSLLAIFAACGVVLAGCSGGDKQEAPKGKDFAPDPNPDSAKGN